MTEAKLELGSLATFLAQEFCISSPKFRPVLEFIETLRDELKEFKDSPGVGEGTGEELGPPCEFYTSPGIWSLHVPRLPHPTKYLED